MKNDTGDKIFYTSLIECFIYPHVENGLLSYLYKICYSKLLVNVLVKIVIPLWIIENITY